MKYTLVVDGVEFPDQDSGTNNIDSESLLRKILAVPPKVVRSAERTAWINWDRVAVVEVRVHDA